MPESVGIIGAGVSGLTCGVLFAEEGYRTRIFAEETGPRITSGAAGAIWFPYDAKPVEAVIAWSLETFEVLRELSAAPESGVSMIELRSFSRTGEIEIPPWSISLGVRRLHSFGRPEMLHKRIRARGSAHGHDTLSRLSRCALPARGR